MTASWDIFCSVVDNYGDIGVTWRLARQLADEQRVTVRLWVDDLRPFQRLCPQADERLAVQRLQGVEVCAWPQQWSPTWVADVVVAAFTCQLPAEYVTAMTQRERAPLWLNLEYLSAEGWVAGCHALPSPQANRLPKFFFFPGFTADTGGLLREHGLIRARQQFQAAAQDRQQFLATLGVHPAPHSRLISLFAYESPGLADWLQALAEGPQACHLLVPEGRVVPDVESWLGEPLTAAGGPLQRGRLHVQCLPFLPQPDYDRLLWSCDFNAVRGEDSFVRAQWAGRPFVWHIYVQEEYAHWEKLEAFLDLYVAALSEPATQALRGLWRAWNQEAPIGAAWARCQAHWGELEQHAEDWCGQLAEQADLASALVDFHVRWKARAG